MDTLLCATAAAASFPLALMSARFTLRIVFRLMAQADVR